MKLIIIVGENFNDAVHQNRKYPSIIAFVLEAGCTSVIDTHDEETLNISEVLNLSTQLKYIKADNYLGNINKIATYTYFYV